MQIFVENINSQGGGKVYDSYANLEKNYYFSQISKIKPSFIDYIRPYCKSSSLETLVYLL
jgi:hypothetical protein